MAWTGGINQFLCRSVKFAVLAVRINQQVGILLQKPAASNRHLTLTLSPVETERE